MKSADRDSRVRILDLKNNSHSSHGNHSGRTSSRDTLQQVHNYEQGLGDKGGNIIMHESALNPLLPTVCRNIGCRNSIFSHETNNQKDKFLYYS